MHNVLIYTVLSLHTFLCRFCALWTSIFKSRAYSEVAESHKESKEAKMVTLCAAAPENVAGGAQKGTLLKAEHHGDAEIGAARLAFVLSRLPFRHHVYHAESLAVKARVDTFNQF